MRTLIAALAGFTLGAAFALLLLVVLMPTPDRVTLPYAGTIDGVRMYTDCHGGLFHDQHQSGIVSVCGGLSRDQFATLFPGSGE